MKINKLVIFFLVLILSLECLSCKRLISKPNYISSDRNLFDTNNYDTDTFQSKLNEYWDTLRIDYIVHEEFKPDYNEFMKGNLVYSYIHTIQGSELSDFIKGKVQIISFKKGDSISFKSFLDSIETYKSLEAIKFDNFNFSNETLDKLFIGLSDKVYFKKIIFTGCNLKALPVSVKLLQRLETLDLSFNELISIPKEIGHLRSLKYLRLYNNRSFNHFPDELGNCINLEYLDFAGASLTELPNTIGNCSNLIKLVGNACKIKFIPDEIENCKKLQDINLAANSIKDLPDNIGSLLELKRIDFSYNLLSSLPDSFKKLKNIKFCGLSHNEIGIFPEQVLGLEKVQNLWLHKNSFKNIPSGIENLEALTHFLVDKSEINQSEIEYLKEKRPDVRIIDP